MSDESIATIVVAAIGAGSGLVAAILSWQNRRAARRDAKAAEDARLAAEKAAEDAKIAAEATKNEIIGASVDGRVIIGKALDGRLSQLLDSETDLAYEKGYKAGEQAQRDRSSEPQK